MAKTETIRTKQKYHAGDTVGCHEVLETLGVIGSTARRDQKYGRYQYGYRIRCLHCGKVTKVEQYQLLKKRHSKTCRHCPPGARTVHWNRPAQDPEVKMQTALKKRNAVIEGYRRPIDEEALWHLHVHLLWATTPPAHRLRFDSECATMPN